jgi:septum formation protein
MIGIEPPQVKAADDLSHCFCIGEALSTPLLILGSTSPYRAGLLRRFRLPFEVRRPEVAEDHIAGEPAAQRAARLALAKARAVAAREPDAVVIGADQVATCEDRILDKPGSREAARAQLRSQSGRAVEFHSAVAVVRMADRFERQFTDLSTVCLRPLGEAEIERYLDADQPWDCAGSLRSEALGAALCERIDSQDPTGLVGLPLIRLASVLRECGYPLP